MTGKPGPRLAAVGRTIEAAPGPAARHPPGVASRLPEAGEQNARIRGIEFDVARPGIGVHEQHVRPGPPAVHRAKDAALRIRAEGVPEEGRESHIRIPRMYRDLADLTLLVEHVLPAPAGVRGLVDAVAGLDVAANIGLPRADVDHVRIRGGDGDRSGREQRLVVEHRLPFVTAVDRLPDAALRGRRIKGQGVAGDAGDPGDPASDRRADRSELEEVELSPPRRSCRERQSDRDQPESTTQPPAESASLHCPEPPGMAALARYDAAPKTVKPDDGFDSLQASWRAPLPPDLRN